MALRTTSRAATVRRIVAGLCCAVGAAVVAAACTSSVPTGSNTTTSQTSTTAASTTGGGSSIPVVPTTVPVSQIVASSTTNMTIGMPKSSLDLAALPLGTGKESDAPKRGYLWVCGVGPSQGGVPSEPWVDTSNDTWDMETKPAVSGEVRHDAVFSATHVGDDEVLAGNGLPPLSGTFPVSSSDPTAEYGADPTALYAHQIKITVPYNPQLASSPSCVMGMAGIAVNGVPILDAFNATTYDAVAQEILDVCHGHTNNQAGYHYHGLSPCLLSAYARSHTTQVGWALDGFGIYVEYDSNGDLLTNADLDACHGRVSVVPWHGKMVDIFHYDMTFEFPYTVGCFMGTKAPAGDILGVHYPGAPY